MPDADRPDVVDSSRLYDPDVDHAFPQERLDATLEAIAEDEEITAYLEAQNVNPVSRKGYNDHGPKHVEIVRNRALSLYELLKKGGVMFNGASQQGLAEADEPVIVALAATLHDIGHVVHQVLHAILCHHTPEKPLTHEAGVVRVADALDMERGRSRIPYEKGGRGINTISSQAIRNVTLQAGDTAPVLVEIEMVDAAGVFQVDELLNAKLRDSRIEDHVRIVAVNARSDDENIVERIEM
ncbi:phosphohydrolase [Halobacteriales archaeon QS_1_68_44]|nr:MAG: phosphohydrolase [Halobacteriales archaeon QS_1_68_44]